MTLSNAERQHRYRQRLKVRAAIIPGAGLYDAAVEHLRAHVDAEGMVRRGYRPPKRQRLSPEALAAEICQIAQEMFQGISSALGIALQLDSPLDECTDESAARVRACLGKIEATLAPPMVTTPRQGEAAQ